MRRENRLISAVRSDGDQIETTILVLEDGTMFFARQWTGEGEGDAGNESWLYIPPIPGVKNSDRVFRVNQGALQQAFIGSDFDLVDLERLNPYLNGDRIEVGEEERIVLQSERYGRQEIRLNERGMIRAALVFEEGVPVKRGEWGDFEKDRPQTLSMTTVEENRRSEVAAEYRFGVELPGFVFDPQRQSFAERKLRAIAEDLFGQ